MHNLPHRTTKSITAVLRAQGGCCNWQDRWQRGSGRSGAQAGCTPNELRGGARHRHHPGMHAMHTSCICVLHRSSQSEYSIVCNALSGSSVTSRFKFIKFMSLAMALWDMNVELWGPFWSRPPRTLSICVRAVRPGQHHIHDHFGPVLQWIFPEI